MTESADSTAAALTAATASTAPTTPPFTATQRFAIGELIWGPSRGYPAWPGKVVQVDMDEQQPQTANGEPAVWVQWFSGGGRIITELVAITSLHSLSDGLEAHHKAQKDTRK